MSKRSLSTLLFICFLCIAMCFTAVSTANAFGRGTHGPDVYAVQGMLKSLGYFPGSIDGIYGPITEHGVKLFQQKYGLPTTGAVDGKTLQSILWAYGNLKISINQPPKVPETPQRKEPGIPGLSAEEQEMINLVNSERVANGLPKLQVDLQLSNVARMKSMDMVKNNYFSHESPTYGSPFEMMKQFGISYTSAGENIACNQSVKAAHTSLMNSQGHRENILSRSYDHIGIGIVDGGKCGKMFTQQFIGK